MTSNEADQKQTFFQRWNFILATAVIICFFSEYFFMNEGPVEYINQLLLNPLQKFGGMIEFILWYSLCVAMWFICISYFRVHNFASFFLSACILGWAIEGTFIPAAYESIPGSFFWTSVTWHVLIDVLIGFCAIRYILNKDHIALTLSAAIALGMFWGFWATWVWPYETEILVTPDKFWSYSLFVSLLWILSLFLTDRLSLQSIEFTKREVIACSLFMLFCYTMTVIGTSGLALTIVPLWVLVFATLRQHKKHALESKASIFSFYDNKQTRLWNYACFLTTPFTASLVYEMLYENSIVLPMLNFIVVLSPLSYLLFAYSIYYIWVKQPKEDPSNNV